MDALNLPRKLTAEDKERESSKKLDTTIHIFEHYYRVRVPTLMSRSVDDIRNNGVIVSGIKEFDQGIENEMSVKLMTINIMIDHYRRGVPIGITYYEDTKKIYEVIKIHLQRWATFLDRGVNVGDAPLDDLIDLDQFADEVFNYARYQYKNQFLDDPVIKNLMTIQPFNFHNFFNEKTTRILTEEARVRSTDNGTRIGNSDDALPEHESLKDFFRDKVISLGRY